MNHRRVLTLLNLLLIYSTATAQVDLSLFPGMKANRDSTVRAKSEIPTVSPGTESPRPEPAEAVDMVQNTDTLETGTQVQPSDTLTHRDDPMPEWMQSSFDKFFKGLGAPVDTIDIGDEKVRVVLKDDNTWYYIKNLDIVSEQDTYKNNWEINVVNPYSTPVDSLPYRMTICLVDTVSRFVCPATGKVFSKFGIRHGRNHTGCDIPYPTGTPVYAAFDGRVRTSMYYKGYGNIIILRHENGLETFYGHLTKRKVEPGEWVHAGDLIGLGGSTGRSTGPHLHFETRVNGCCFDPERIIDFESGKLRRNVIALKRSYFSTRSRYVPTTLDDEDFIYMTEEQIKAEEERIAAERAAEKYHTIKNGDTLGGIAHKYGTSVSRICSLNNNLSPTTTLRLGRKIRVK